MARTVTVNVVSDLSSTGPAETVEFGFDGRIYEIDLTEDEKTELAAALERYMAKAQLRIGKGRKTTVKPARVALGPSSETVRAWAASAGIEVSAKGRISAAVMDAYRAAHPGE